MVYRVFKEKFFCLQFFDIQRRCFKIAGLAVYHSYQLDQSVLEDGSSYFQSYALNFLDARPLQGTGALLPIHLVVLLALIQ